MSWHKIKNFHYKNMAYEQSCFPCCIQIILSNLKNFPRDNAIEDEWNKFQIQNNKPDLNARPPTEDDVLSNLAKMDLGSGVAMRVITPLMLEDVDPKRFEVEMKVFFDTFPAMIIGVDHAGVLYKEGYKEDKYISIETRTDIGACSAELVNNVTIEIFDTGNDVGNDTKYGLKLKGNYIRFGPSNNFRLGGNFIIGFR